MSSLNITGNEAPDNHKGRQHDEQPRETRQDRAPGNDPSSRRGYEGVDLLHLLATSNQVIISPEVKAFIDHMQTSLSESLPERKVTIVPCTPVPSVYIVRAWKGEQEFVFLLGFTSMMPRVESPYQPASTKLSTAADILTKNNSRLVIAGLQLLAPQDISVKSNVIISMVSRKLDQAMRPQNYALTLRSLTSDTTLDVLSSDVEQARSYISRYNPSVVEPRVDIGFITSVKVPNDVYANLSEADRAIVDHNNLTENSMPVSAVGATVDFIGPLETTDARGNKITQYVPRISVTAQAMFVDSPLFTLLNFLTINQVWAENHGWMDYFLTQGSNGVNISNLCEGDEPGTIDDTPPEEFLRRNASFFADPIVTFDVAIGRYGSNFLFDLAASDTQLEYLIDEIQRVLNDNNDDFRRDLADMRDFRSLVVSAGRRFEGYIRTRGALVDSRSLDYLSQIRHGKMDKVAAEELLDLNDDPVRRLENLETLFDGPANYESLYDTDVAVITQEFLAALANAFARLRVKIYDRDGARRRRSLGGLSSASTLAGFGWNKGTGNLFTGSSRGGRRTNDEWSAPLFSRRS